MARIEHHSTSGWSVTQVQTALSDPEYLRDRLRELGGADTEIVEHEKTGEGVRFAVRQGVPVDELPAMVRQLVGANLVVDRTESWRRADERHCTGEIAARVAGVPGSITGSMWLREMPGGGSELVVDGEVKVSLPLVGGKIEALAAEQLQGLLAAEAEFTSEWLSRRG
jgi:hypothetical protein